MKKCQFCKEIIQDEAIKCKHCGSMLNGSMGQRSVPEELKRWNWAAFLWGPIWAIGHNVWLGLLCFVPVPLVYLVMIFILGAKGNQWAWERNHYSSIDQFLDKQRFWVRVWLIIWGSIIGLGFVMALVIPLFFQR